MIRWALLAALLTGCGSSSIVYVDERFTQEEQAQIQAAADVWPVPIDLLFNQRVTAYDTGRRILVRTDAEVISLVLDETIPAGSAAATIENERILMAMDRSPAWHFQTIVAHEFGHLLKVKHVDDPTALMFWQTSALTRMCVSKADSDGSGGTVPVTCPSESSP